VSTTIMATIEDSARRDRGPVTTPAIGAALGGLAGTLAMNYAQRLWTVTAGERPPASAADLHDARDWQERSEHQNSNELAATALARLFLGRRSRGRNSPSLPLPFISPLVRQWALSMAPMRAGDRDGDRASDSAWRSGSPLTK
jgi:hypothetical protein